jgi:chromate transporter
MLHPPENDPLLPAANRPSLFEIAWSFLLLGALAFGGQGGLLALLNRDFVERRRWITEADVVEAFTYVQLLPGAVVVQVVAYLGYKLRSWRGAAAATTCFLLPSVAVMLLLASVYRSVAAVAGVPAALQGLTAAVVGLIAVAAWKQGRKTVTDALGLVTAVLVCAASVWGHMNPAVLVIAAGLIGVIRESRSRQAPFDDGDPKPPLTAEEGPSK